MKKKNLIITIIILLIVILLCFGIAGLVFKGNNGSDNNKPTETGTSENVKDDTNYYSNYECKKNEENDGVTITSKVDITILLDTIYERYSNTFKFNSADSYNNYVMPILENYEYNIYENEDNLTKILSYDVSDIKLGVELINDSHIKNYLKRFSEMNYECSKKEDN